MFISGAAVLAVLLAGCGSPDTEAETGAAAESQTATKSIDETENVISEEQAFYDYLQNTVIPEKGWPRWRFARWKMAVKEPA